MAENESLWARELKKAKRAIIEAALARHGGYVVATAHELGITETALYRHCKELGISTKVYRDERRAPIAPRRPARLSGWLAHAAQATEEDHDET